MKFIITTMIRVRFENAKVVCPPRKKKHLKKLERTQRTAAKMVSELEDLTYEQI